METLAASLQVVRSTLSPTLVPARAFDRLGVVAAKLAPIHCAGFEVRLGGEPSPVDLIQRVRVLAGEPDRLARHIDATPSLAGDVAWCRLRAFLEIWSDPKSLAHTSIAGAFLEFDADAELLGTPMPSMYLSLEPGSPREIDSLLDLIEETARLLRGERFDEDVDASLRKCHDALPPEAAISDVGMMLSREIDAVRLVVAPLSRERIGPYLGQLDWIGSSPDIESTLALIPERVTYLGLSLDVGAAVFPRIGLEYYPGPFDDDLPAWNEALDNLVAADLCTTVERNALLEWPGCVEPTAETSWPDSLLVDSLLNRPDHFCVLAKRLTFLKLVCQAGAAPQAKVYFGFGPRSFVSATVRAETSANELAAGGFSVSQAPADGRGAAIALVAGSELRDGTPRSLDTNRLRPACNEAVDAAIAYLLEQRGRDGMWREFPRILEGSDEWVTAYVGTVLASTTSSSGRAAALDAWHALGQRRGSDQGWGYNEELPLDADSTLWGVRLAHALGLEDSPRAAAARIVLERHVLANGGVSTHELVAEAGLRRLLGDADLTGMFVAHTCVSAAVAGLDTLRDRVLPFVLAAQEANGRWRGYWWSDDEYTTLLAVHALALGPVEDSFATASSAALKNARAWAAQRIDRSGAVWSRSLGGVSAFATALCAEITMVDGLEMSGSPDPAQDRTLTALEWLLQAQQTDGSWPPSALLRMPPPDAVDGDERPAATTVSIDDRALFTTATTIRTLTAAISSRRISTR